MRIIYFLIGAFLAMIIWLLVANLLMLNKIADGIDIMISPPTESINSSQIKHKEGNMRVHTFTGVNTRRISALKRLEKQLKDGKKPLESMRLVNNNFTRGEQVMQPLEDKDITRIQKEIAILHSKIK